MKQREYWQDRIIDWEKACYDQKAESLPLIERVANLFRRAVRYRRQLGYRMLASQPRERVLELGCGSGAFALALLTENAARTMVAVDISTAAIDAARLKAREAGVADRVQFIASDLENLDFAALGQFDYVIGLGLTPYLTDKEVERVFKTLGEAPFLFDFHRKGLNYINVAHAVFRAIKGHPFYRLFSSAEISELLTRSGVKGFRVGSEGGVDFVFRQ
jgi:methylase of polypeptide subunit release factors